MWQSLQGEQAQVFRGRVICVWFCGRTSSVWLDNNTTFSNYRSTSPQPGLNNHNPLPLGICLREALQLIWTLKPQTTPFSMMAWQKAGMNVVDLKGPFSGGLLVEGKNFSLFPNSSLPLTFGALRSFLVSTVFSPHHPNLTGCPVNLPQNCRFLQVGWTTVLFWLFARRNMGHFQQFHSSSTTFQCRRPTIIFFQLLSLYTLPASEHKPRDAWSAMTSSLNQPQK